MSYKNKIQQKEYQKVWYQKNKERLKNGTLASRARMRAINREYVQLAKAAPCMDCGNKYHYSVMDFDHRPDEIKTKNVSILADQYSLEIVKLEIAKCDLVCSNCHRIRTFRRRFPNIPV